MAPGNCQLTSPIVQKDIINACAKETTKSILEELNGGFFAILTDKSTNISDKEQMALYLRYINKKEEGQGYNGASNMQGAINGLKTLVLNECPQAYFVHCFAHQLQLTQVIIAKKNSDCGWLFVDERGLGRPYDTRWGSHFKTILNVLDLYPTILESLDAIAEVSDTIDSNKAQSITHLLMSFDFVFVAKLMVAIFGITNELNVAPQKHDQDIVIAMAMVDITKTNLQKM
ncbi:uncharacterized protein LOC141679326 [Apium graveolens]|uniref:uncharacterized protein LOC141679326 n=1 Tax=Apium graveolens TaxID=4045 RepID=UPI003D7B8765